jgi:predicted nucleic acid-binding protein
VTVFVDTSALLAVLNSRDPHHRSAAAIWRELVSGGEPLRSHTYVEVETTAVVQHRSGMSAVRALHEDLFPVVSRRHVDAALHGQALAGLFAANRRTLSLVDWTSFEMMRQEGIIEAFAYDSDFDEQGFTLRS